MGVFGRVGGIAKGDCRSREFARFSFVLSVAETTIYKIYSSLSALVCSNRDSHDLDTSTREKRKVKEAPAREFHLESAF